MLKADAARLEGPDNGALEDKARFKRKVFSMKKEVRRLLTI